jgi:hypothetical protein
MSADELIYKVKLEQDLKSFQEVEKALENIEKKARSGSGSRGSGGGRSGGGRSSETQKEISELQELRKQLKENREDLAELNKMKREGTVLSNEFSTSQQDTIQNIRTLSTQIQDATRGYTDQNTAITSTATTYNELTAQNRALSIAMRDIPLSDQTGRLQQLQAQYTQNNAKLKEFDASMGNFQRNVGDYTGGLRSFASTLAVIQGPLGPIAGRLNALATTIDKLGKMTSTSSETQSTLGKVMMGNIPLITASATATTAQATATTIANTAIKGLNFTLKALRVALIATGVGAILIAFVSLVQAFKRTEEGAQKLRVIMAGFSAVSEVILDRLSALGRVLISAFENPQQAVKDLWEAIKQNLVNRVTALPMIFNSVTGAISKNLQGIALAVKGIWSEEAREASKKLFEEAGKDYKTYLNGIIQLTTGVEDLASKVVAGAKELNDEINREVEQRKALEEAMNKVLVNERELSVERAEQNKNLQEAREIARNLDEDAQKRLEALQQVGKAEDELAEKELANERERLRIMQAQMKISDTDEPALKAEADQRAKLLDLERESSMRKTKLLRDVNTVERQIREENLRRERTQFEILQANRELGFAKVRDNLIEEGRLTEALQIDLTRIEEESEKEKTKLKKLYFTEFIAQKFKAEEAKRLAEEKAEIETQENIYKAKKALTDQEKKEQIDKQKFDQDVALRRTEMLLAFEQDRLNRQGRFVEAALLNDLDKQKLKETLFNQFKDQLIAEGKDKDEAGRRAKEMAELESSKRIKENEQILADAELQQRLNMAMQITNGLEAINNAFFNESKEISVAKAIIDAIAGASSAFTETKAGIAGKSAAAAAALAMGYANVKKILAVKKGTKSTSSAKMSAPKVSSSFGLVDVGTNRQPFAEAMATGAQPAGTGNGTPTIVLAGEFDPAFLAVKVTMGNNQISSQGTGF